MQGLRAASTRKQVLRCIVGVDSKKFGEHQSVQQTSVRLPGVAPSAPCSKRQQTTATAYVRAAMAAKSSCVSRSTVCFKVTALAMDSTSLLFKDRGPPKSGMKTRICSHVIYGRHARQTPRACATPGDRTNHAPFAREHDSLPLSEHADFLSSSGPR